MKSTNIFLQFEFNQLRNGKHSVEDMQDDFIKYGEDYSFFILDEIQENIKIKYEIAEVKDEKEKVQAS